MRRVLIGSMLFGKFKCQELLEAAYKCGLALTYRAPAAILNASKTRFLVGLLVRKGCLHLKTKDSSIVLSEKTGKKVVGG